MTKKSFLKRLLTLLVIASLSLLTVFTFTKANAEGTNVEGDHRVEIWYGLGGKPGTSASTTKVITKDYNNADYDGMARTGYTTGDYHGNGSGTETYAQTMKANATGFTFVYGEKSIYVSMDDFAELGSQFFIYQDMTVAATDPEGKSFLKVGGGLAAYKNGSTKNAMRFTNVLDDVKIIFHYENETTLTINGDDDFTVSGSKFPGYIGKTENGYTGYTIGTAYQAAEGAPYAVTINSAAEVVEATVKVGETTETLTKEQYLDYANGEYFTIKNGVVSGSTLSQNITIDLTFKKPVVTFAATEDETNYLVGEATQTVQPFSHKLAVLPEVQDRTGETTPKFFLGWYNSNNQKVTTETVFTEDTTLTAKWTDRIVNVKFLPTGEDDGEAYTEQIGANTYVNYRDPGTKEGYFFLGWYNGDVPFNFEETIANDVTVTAKWTNTKYTVTFDMQEKAANQSAQVFEQDKAVQPANKPMATDPAYKFVGWYTEPECSHEYDFNTPVTADLTLYAKWDAYYEFKLVAAANHQGNASSSNADATVDGFLVSAYPQAKAFNVYYSLDSMAGLALEPYKVEVYSLGNLVATLGADFTSSNAADAVDQTETYESENGNVTYTKGANLGALVTITAPKTDYVVEVYYKNYSTDTVYRYTEADFTINYNGSFTVDSSEITLKPTLEKISATNAVVDGNTVTYKTRTTQASSVVTVGTPNTLGSTIDYIVVTINGESYNLGEGFYPGQSVTMSFKGATIVYAKSTDGTAKWRVYGVTNNTQVTITPVVSNDHKYTLTMDAGFTGVAVITDMPATTEIVDPTDPDGKVIVLAGSTPKETGGAGTSIRWDITPDVGYEIDNVTVTIDGTEYVMDHKTIKNYGAVTLVVTTASEYKCVIRYNRDSNGVVQLRLVHIEADVDMKVNYKEDNYELIVYTRELAKLRGEANEVSSYFAESTPNFQSWTVPAGTTNEHKNGIKFWIKPMNSESSVTAIQIKNSRGDVVVGGVGLKELEYEDVKMLGCVVRVYRAENGIYEIRVWTIADDIVITPWFDNETPDPNVVIKDDYKTQDLGPYDNGSSENTTTEGSGNNTTNPTRAPKPTTSNQEENTSSSKKGCKGSIVTLSIISIISVASIAIVAKRKEE